MSAGESSTLVFEANLRRTGNPELGETVSATRDATPSASEITAASSLRLLLSTVAALALTAGARAVLRPQAPR